jgi:agmatine deiminase
MLMAISPVNGYPKTSVFYPPEWHKQKAIWLSYPHNLNEWNDIRLKPIRAFYHELIKLILEFQDINLVFANEDLKNNFPTIQGKFKVNPIVIPNNDIWIRDYGPFFVFNNNKIEMLDFEFNAWGEKFPPWNLDNEVPAQIEKILSYPRSSFDMVLEGGALEFNGDGVILTTKQCLLNSNRNPHLNQNQIEKNLKNVFNIDDVIWLERGLEGDHTDGHIDDFARFYDYNKVFLCASDDATNPNYQHLKDSFEVLSKWKHSNKKYNLEVTLLPMPVIMKLDGEYLPNSYANFIFLNGAVIVPTFDCPQDEIALEIFCKALPSHQVIGLNSRLLVEEGGGLHCMSKQEPSL